MLDNTSKNKNPFKVPENYFQNFNADIMDKLPAKQPIVKKVPLWKKVVPWTAVAAAFVGILFLTGIFDRNMATDPTTLAQHNEPLTFSNMTASEAEDFYYSFLEDEVQKGQFKEMVYNIDI